MKAILMCAVVAMVGCSAAAPKQEAPAEAPKIAATDAGTPAPSPHAETWTVAGKCAAPGIWCGAWVSSKGAFEPSGCIPFAPCVVQQKPAPAAGK